ncbi:MAG TPA: AraC family transcriptional regulator ligand-binding domain-containing protein [Tahibacter sp.]|uniref:AraC family transcriptional regulator n=1 Tax=Tahibacter sp. TaxID=2056211 RepID=UPI002B676A37|nr:AraC family transcriptional regulator ligand-binding domain-containing protein [Tahibacter sp.]HSX61153.1 AraC family transcriptional regulator ligand-binding domain-containing protein [Tahibacter sp.]
MSRGDVSRLYADAFAEFANRSGALPASDAVAATPGFVQRVDGQDFGRRVQQAVDASGDADLGVRFGAAIGGRGFGLLGIATATAPSLQQSLASLVRWEPLTSTLGRIGIRRSRRHLRLTWTPHVAVPPAAIEGILGGWVAFGRFLVGENVPVVALELAHARRARSEADAVLGCEVRFGAACNAVVIPLDILDARPRYADVQLHAALAQWLDDCVQVLGGGDAAVFDAGRLILDRLALGETSEDLVAEGLGLARRTFQRRLAQNGLSFRRLRDLLRASVAVCRLSGGSERLLDVAQHVGFAEQATFTRAVRQWTARTPREVARLFAADYAALRR